MPTSRLSLTQRIHLSMLRSTLGILGRLLTWVIAPAIKASLQANTATDSVQNSRQQAGLVIDGEARRVDANHP